MREVPCGTRLGVRTTLEADPAHLRVNTLRRPKPLAAVVDHFNKGGLVTFGCPVLPWEEAWGKTHRRAKAHVLANRIPEIDVCVQVLGIESQTTAVAVTYAQWSVAAEYRVLVAKGIRVNEISFEYPDLYLGRGRMPVLENVLLSGP